MTVYFYESGFDLLVSPGNTFSATFGTAGKSDVVITDTMIIAAVANQKSKIFHKLDLNGAHTTFTPADPSGPTTFTDWADDDFAAALQAAIRAEATVQSWSDPTDWTVTLSDTGYYTIGYTHANFTMSFATSTFAQYVLGFASASYSSAKTYTGTLHPYYLIVPTLPELSLVSDKYEPSNIASQAIPDSCAMPYGLARTVGPTYYDWIQQYETKARTFTYEAVAPDIWPYETMIKYCRTVYPFIVYTSGASLVCFLREQAAFFKPEPIHPDFDDYWHIPFKTVLLGTAVAK